jgi:hypothetical protein
VCVRAHVLTILQPFETALTLVTWWKGEG